MNRKIVSTLHAFSFSLTHGHTFSLSHTRTHTFKHIHIRAHTNTHLLQEAIYTLSMEDVTCLVDTAV